MAAIDSIKDAYRQYLGREASDDEANNWASGAYGHGDANNLAPVLSAIQNSHEARQRNPNLTPQAPPPVIGPSPGENHRADATTTPDVNYPLDAAFAAGMQSLYQTHLGRNASGDEINNWWSGNYGYGKGWAGFDQFQNAIKNSGEALARTNTTTNTTTTTGTKKWGDPAGNWEPWLLNTVFKGLAPNPQSLASLEKDLAAYGIKLGGKNSQGFIDKIILPDGTVWDVIEAATPTGGVRWQFIPDKPGGPGVGGGPLPPNQYSDPNTALLESLLKARIGTLQGGYDDTARRQYEMALQDRARALSTGNAQLDQLMKYLQERFTNLKGPGYTGAEHEVLRTAALDPIERDRTTAKQRLTERLSAMGHRPGSGVFEQAMLELNKEFEGIRGVQQTQLATNELGRRENRNQRAEAIAAQLADIPELRSREQLDVFSALNNLSALARDEDAARSREAISYGGVLSDMGPQRLQLAMQAAGLGGNPAQLGGMLTNIMGLNQNQASMNQNNNSSLWSGLGTLAAIMARSGQSGLSGAGF